MHILKCAGLALALALPLEACSATGGFQLPAAPPLPKTPSQAFIEVNGAYDTALSIAASYRQLPLCGPTAQIFCAQQSILDTISADVAKASPLMDLAQTAVQAVGAGADAVAKARTAVATLTADTAPLAAKVAAAHAAGH